MVVLRKQQPRDVPSLSSGVPKKVMRLAGRIGSRSPIRRP
jgi:hypothetical protein